MALWQAVGYRFTHMSSCSKDVGSITHRPNIQVLFLRVTHGLWKIKSGDLVGSSWYLTSIPGKGTKASLGQGEFDVIKHSAEIKLLHSFNLEGYWRPPACSGPDVFLKISRNKNNLAASQTSIKNACRHPCLSILWLFQLLEGTSLHLWLSCHPFFSLLSKKGSVYVRPHLAPPDC